MIINPSSSHIYSRKWFHVIQASPSVADHCFVNYEQHRAPILTLILIWVRRNSESLKLCYWLNHSIFYPQKSFQVPAIFLSSDPWCSRTYFILCRWFCTHVQLFQQWELCSAKTFDSCNLIIVEVKHMNKNHFGSR